MNLKNPRIIIWLACIAISLILIAPNPYASGYSVTYVSKNSTTGLTTGETIYKINDEKFSPSMLSQNYSGMIRLDTSRGTKYSKVNGTLGIDVEKTQPVNLNFGLDLKGGVLAVVEPINASDNLTITQIINTFQTRINVYGLRESTFRPIWYEGKGYVEISIAGGSEQELRELLERQGKFEAKIPVLVRLTNGVGTLTLDKTYTLVAGNDSVVVKGDDNNTITSQKDFSLAGIPFHVENVNDKIINLTSTVFTGSDIQIVFFDPQKSRVEYTGSGYNWMFSIQISQTGAQKFSWITQNIPLATNAQTGRRSLESMIYFYLDGNSIDALTISSDLKGKVETQISITGASLTQESAVKERSKLQSILRSGALPTPIRIIQLDTVSPNLGENFLRNTLIAGFAAIVGVAGVVMIRYRKIKFALPMLAVSLSEVLIILGIAALIKWTIDLSAIAGIVATVGTGVDSQIVMIDQALRKEDRFESLNERLKRAFFIIFGAGGVVIAAMFPLMIFGFGLLRGFAITTIIGVLVGILVTRPAFGVIVEKIVEK